MVASNNRIFVCGMNSYNQLGLENESAKYLFRSIEDLIKIVLQEAKEIEKIRLQDSLSMCQKTSKYFLCV